MFPLYREIMILFEVDGKPIPYTLKLGRGRIYNPNLTSMEQIKWQIKPYAPKEPFKGPAALDLSFYFKVPASWSATKKRQAIAGTIHHTEKPDTTNLIKLLEDCLKGIFIVDDRQIVHISGHKHWFDQDKAVVKLTFLESMARFE